MFGDYLQICFISIILNIYYEYITRLAKLLFSSEYNKLTNNNRLIPKFQKHFFKSRDP